MSFCEYDDMVNRPVSQVIGPSDHLSVDPAKAGTKLQEEQQGNGASRSNRVRIITEEVLPPKPIVVAAYCRVSTDIEAQESSLKTQIESYRRIISEHPGWILGGIYADKGISGTTVRRRTEFLRMIADAKAGKIQYIIAKSISRFSRNTLDTLEYVRQLKAVGVSVYFEKERIDTGSSSSELILTILAAAAQEEILSLSNNVKLGRRMRNAAGIVQWNDIYGYRHEALPRSVTRGSTAALLSGNLPQKLCEAKWIVEEYEAGIVRRVFDQFCAGVPLSRICKDLNAEGVASPKGKAEWLPTGLVWKCGVVLVSICIPAGSRFQAILA